MQRLEWHCHTKSVSGALYEAILYHCQSAGKEMANSAVFNFWRNAGSDWISLTEVGREFQACDASDGNARSPMVARRVGGTTSVNVEADRRRRRPCTSAVDWSVSARYSCAVPWRQRCVRTHKRNCILSGTFNQCSSRRSGTVNRNPCTFFSRIYGCMCAYFHASITYQIGSGVASFDISENIRQHSDSNRWDYFAELTVGNAMYMQLGIAIPGSRISAVFLNPESWDCLHPKSPKSRIFVIEKKITV